MSLYYVILNSYGKGRIHIGQCVHQCDSKFLLTRQYLRLVIASIDDNCDDSFDVRASLNRNYLMLPCTNFQDEVGRGKPIGLRVKSQNQ